MLKKWCVILVAGLAAGALVGCGGGGGSSDKQKKSDNPTISYGKADAMFWQFFPTQFDESGFTPVEDTRVYYFQFNKIDDELDTYIDYIKTNNLTYKSSSGNLTHYWLNSSKDDSVSASNGLAGDLGVSNPSGTSTETGLQYTYQNGSVTNGASDGNYKADSTMDSLFGNADGQMPYTITLHRKLQMHKIYDFTNDVSGSSSDFKTKVEDSDTGYIATLKSKGFSCTKTYTSGHDSGDGNIALIDCTQDAGNNVENEFVYEPSRNNNGFADLQFTTQKMK
jgi:hypothetical protein